MCELISIPTFIPLPSLSPFQYQSSIYSLSLSLYLSLSLSPSLILSLNTLLITPSLSRRLHCGNPATLHLEVPIIFEDLLRALTSEASVQALLTLMPQSLVYFVPIATIIVIIKTIMINFSYHSQTLYSFLS